MTWSTIIKKTPSTEFTKESFKKLDIKYDLLPSNESADIFKINKEEILFNDLLCIKESTEQLINLLGNTRFQDIPQKIKEMRNDADAFPEEEEIGAHLTLLWDDPTCLPPDVEHSLENIG